jgi:hypothetical protein
MNRTAFEAPDNWCDSKCRRCTLRTMCRAAVPEPPDESCDPEPDSIRYALEEGPPRAAERMLQQIANHHGPNANPPVSSLPSDWSTGRLMRANLGLARCVFVLEVTGALQPDDAAECLRLCLTLSGKSARVMSYLLSGPAELWASDAVPNLLLIELTLAQLCELLEPLDDENTGAALHEVQQLLAPLFATVDDVARARLSELVRAGRAPSPFLTGNG